MSIESADNILHVKNSTMRISRVEVGQTLSVGNIEFENTTTLTSVTSNGNNTTPYTISSSNVTTGLATTANVVVGGDLVVSGNATVTSNLEVGTANLYVDTVSSNVGVGTNLPLAKLDVKGDIGLVGNIYSDSNLSVQYTTENPSNTWAQVGGDFFGETASDRLGFSVAISADGLRIALGEYQHNSNAGRVIVFDWNGSTWIQAGVDIDGSGEFGYGISLSSDGKRLVVGAPGTTNGNAKVYDWSGSAWVQVGGDLTGTASGDRFGVAVSISGDKTRIVVGAIIHDSSRGEAKIYEYHQGSATWVQLGSTLDGEATGDRFGYSSAMSSNGSRVAIGADNNDGGGTDAGHVRVFDWDGSVWTQAGADIDGESAGDLMGHKGEVSLSSDGLRLAVGARRDDATGTDAGHARVFDWNGTAWVQVGTDIDGEAAGDEFGMSVALSPDGSRLAVGGHSNDAGGSDAGHARVFEYIGGSWTQIGADLDGNDPSGLFGTAVALSSNGSRLVVGGPRVDGSGGSEAGVVKVFDYDGVLKTKQIIKEDIVEIPGDLRAGCPVFFQAAATGSTINATQLIPYNNVLNNKGGGYNPSTRLFTAPIAGFYHFSFYHMSNNAQTEGIFTLNGTYVKAGGTPIRVHSNVGSGHSPVSASLNVYMNASDTMGISLTSGNMYMSSSQYAGFNGFYLSS